MSFFKLGEAFKELTSAVGAKDTAFAGAKLVGKTLFNTGKIAVEVAVKAAEMQSEKNSKNTNLTDEQRERSLESNERFKEIRINGEVKENRLLIQQMLKEIESKIVANNIVIDDEECTQEKRVVIATANHSLSYIVETVKMELKEVKNGDFLPEHINKRLALLISQLEEKLEEKLEEEFEEEFEEEKSRERAAEVLIEKEKKRTQIEKSDADISGTIQLGACNPATETLRKCIEKEELGIDYIEPLLVKTRDSISDEKRYSEPDLIDYLSRIIVDGEGKNRVFVHSEIPLDRLNNAISARSFPEALKSEQALLLIDDTARFGGREGLLLTDKRFSFKSLFSDSDDFIYAPHFNGQFDVQKKKVFRMGNVAKEFVYLDQLHISNIFTLINDFLQDRYQWHESKAKEGHVQSQFFLSSNTYLKPDVEEYWLTKAAENGHIVAQHNMGMRLLHKNEEQAFYWFTLAAEQGSEESKKRLLGENFVKNMRSTL